MYKPEKKNVSNVLERGATGATIGATVGSAFTPVGAAIGAGVGFLAGSVLGAVENKATFDAQMDLYRISQKNDKEAAKMAKASRRQALRDSKRQDSKGTSAVEFPRMDSADKQLMAMGGSTGYDSYMGGKYA
tara:strand:+ start:54 stop:449 length:396 start_codon:yes stop_codon:yes gene_type:complete